MVLSLVLLLTSGAFEPVVIERLDAANGSPALQLGQLSQPLTGELSAAVQAWSLSQRATFKLPAVSTLRFSHAFATRFGGSFHLLQEVGGVEVYGSRLVVTLDTEARVVQTSSSLSGFEFIRDTWSLDETQALQKAAAGVVLPMLQPNGVPYGGLQKMYFEVGAELHAGYLAHVASLDFTKNWYVAVDAVTGERLFVQNRVHHALDANMYPISPGGLDAGVGATPTTKVQLRHLDGGSMVADTCDGFLADGGWETTPNSRQELCGFQMTQFNCCPREGCQADAGTKRVSGRTTVNIGVPLDLQFSMAVCDRIRRASPLSNDAGSNYAYTPVDPPKNKATVVLDDPANSDEFAEVQSFYHVNRVYDWVRGLSAAGQTIFAGQQPAVRVFAMRDERRMPSRKPAIWANVMFPNFNELQTNIQGGFGCVANPPCITHSDTLLRIDNAAFFPRENFSQLPIPGFDTGVDTLLIFQGNSADAAYDATVIQHEFGHGVVYATAAITFDKIAIDSRSANNEGGALHEGFADYIAGAFNDVAEIGPYFGPRALAGTAVAGVRQDGYLRTLNNDLSCPAVLWGEVHQDSQHVAAALWAGRAAFRGSDNGNTYDAAFYAMLVSIAPSADFASVAAAMTARVKQAFPTVATAEAQMTAIFTAKGVIGCSKVLDVTGASSPRAVYQIAAAPDLPQAVIPGPIQFKLRTPKGATKVHVSAKLGSGSPIPGATPPVLALVKENAPITFTRSGGGLTNDATQSVQLSSGGLANITVSVPCGAASEVYVTLASTGGGGAAQNVSVTFDAPATCVVASDGGTTDRDDGGVDTKTIPSVGAGSTTSAAPAKTCGCSSGELGPMLGLGLAALALRRRKRGQAGF